MFLGREPLRAPFKLIDRKKIHADTEPCLKRLGLDVSSRTRLDKLSLAQRQMVEIAKALSLKARLIIMDEPTSSLTLSETERLLELVCELSAQNISIIYISHRLGEIEHCADRVVVLRDGKNAGQLLHSEISHDRIVSQSHFAHNKFLVVSDANGPTAVWTGSTNWTVTGLCTQSNNAILLTPRDMLAAF